jgi:hypothetical protein
MATADYIAIAAACLAFVASVVATAASLYSTRFARFAWERWWELQAQAYAEMIRALSDMVDYYSSVSDAEIEGRRISPERMAEITQRWQKGHRRVTRATNMGAFLISPDAEDALQAFQRGPADRRDPDDWFGQLDQDYR